MFQTKSEGLGFLENLCSGQKARETRCHQYRFQSPENPGSAAVGREDSMRTRAGRIPLVSTFVFCSDGSHTHWLRMSVLDSIQWCWCFYSRNTFADLAWNNALLAVWLDLSQIKLTSNINHHNSHLKYLPWFLRNIKIDLPSDSAIAHLGIYPNEIKSAY